MLLAPPLMMGQVLLKAPDLAPVAICAMILVLVATVCLYPAQVRSLGRRWRWALPALRGTALVALAASLAKPAAVRTASSSERGSILLLIDRSKSMSVTDNTRSPAQLVALADALGRIPAGARSDSTAGLAGLLDRLRTAAANVKSAVDDLDYARVSGRDITLRQARQREALAKYAEAARSVTTRAESIDPESDLYRRLADLAQVPPAEAQNAWKSDLPARINRAIDALAQFQASADDQLYHSREDVRAACDETAQLSRFALVQQALLRPGGVVARLRAQGDVTAFSLSDVAAPMDLPQSGPLAAAPNGYTTNLTDGIAEAVAGRNVRAAVVISDGRQVSGDRTVLPGLVPAGVPLFAVSAAAPAAPRDLAFADVRAPSSVFAGQQFSVRVDLLHPGISRADVVVHLDAPDSSPPPRTIHIRENQPATATFPLRLSGNGAQKIRLWFARSEGEITDANNQVERWVKVVPQRMKVLLIAGSPGWDFQFVRKAMLRSPEIETRDILLRPGSKLSIPRRELSDQDVVVLFDPPPAAIDATQWDDLEQLAERKGASVILVAGTHLPAESGKAAPIALSKLLPYKVLGYAPAWRVWPGELPEFHFVPPASAQGLDVLRLSESDTAATDTIASHWEQLPGCFRFVQLPEADDRDAWKANVRPLLIESESHLPVLTEMRIGAGRAFFLGTDETWRWRLKSGERDQDRFWRQLINYASDQPYFARSNTLALDTDKVSAEPNEPVHVRARLSDERPGPARKLELEVLRDGKPFATHPLDPADPAGSGRFTATLALPAGDYLLRWSLAAQRGKMATVQVPLHVAASDEAELANLAGDERMLRKIADAANGQYLTLEQINTLPERLAGSMDTHPRVAEVALWDSPYLFFLVLGCLGTEWALRKRVGLA